LFAFDNSSTGLRIYCAESLSTNTESPYTDAESLYTDLVEQTPITTDYDRYPAPVSVCPHAVSVRPHPVSVCVHSHTVYPHRASVQLHRTHVCPDCCLSHSTRVCRTGDVSVGQYISRIGQVRPPDSSGIGWWRITPPLQQSTRPGYKSLSIHVVCYHMSPAGSRLVSGCERTDRVCVCGSFDDPTNSSKRLLPQSVSTVVRGC